MGSPCQGAAHPAMGAIRRPAGGEPTAGLRLAHARRRVVTGARWGV